MKAGRYTALLFAPAIIYQVLSIVGAIGQRRKRDRHSQLTSQPFQPGVSVLKPVSGLDPNTAEAFLSQVMQDYPLFEILFGVSSLSDPAVPLIRHLQQLHPDVSIKLIVSETRAPNGKVGVLMDLARQAAHPVWVVNDGDIRVTPSYLASVLGPLADQSVGVVTCPYRASAHSLPTTFEALGIATDFMPSAVVAQLLGVREFGFGSTLAFRAADLQSIGGFAALAPFLADDYQLARRISALGKRSILSSYVVETSLGEASWAGVWKHQRRWAKTIRASKGAGYAGLPVTHAGSWALLAALLGQWTNFAGIISVRIFAAYMAGTLVLRSPVVQTWGWCAPLWDCYATAVWLSAYFGNRVKWRQRVLTLGRNGVILDRVE